MSHDVQIAIYDRTAGTGQTSLCLPSIPQVTFSDFNALKNHIDIHSKSHTFITLLMDLNGENSSVLEHLRQQVHIFAIFVCKNPRCRLNFSGGNVYSIPRQLIKRKITLSVIQFFESAASNLLESNQLALALMCKQKANVLKDQLRCIQGPIKGTHVLLDPLNTADQNLYDTQERLINLCNDLYPDDEIIVSTIYDYISSSMDSNFNENEDADMICQYLKRISPIRIHLLGNEPCIQNLASKYLFDHESNSNNEDEYDTNYTLMENQPVVEQILSNLTDVLRCTQPLTNIRPKRLEDIRDDIKFVAALGRAIVTLKAREMVADVELSEAIMNNPDNSLEYTGSLHIVSQAQHGPTVPNDGTNEAINDIIQCDTIQQFFH